MTRGRTPESARRSALSSPARDASSTSRGDIARGCAREAARGEEWSETRARSERRVVRRSSSICSSACSGARGRHSGAARLRGAPCATSPVSTGTRSASGTSPSPRNTSRGACRGARRTTTTSRPRLVRDATAVARHLTFAPPNTPPPPRQGAPRRARPRESSRLETRRRRLRARGRFARARLLPRRRRRPTRPQEESTRRPRARRPSRRAPRPSSRVTLHRPATARRFRRARSARAPSRRGVSAPIPVRGDAREADRPPPRHLVLVLVLVLVVVRSRVRPRSPPRRPPPRRPMGRPRRRDPRSRTPRRPRAHRARPRRVERVAQPRARARVIDARLDARPMGPRAHDSLPDNAPAPARLPAVDRPFAPRGGDEGVAAAVERRADDGRR